MFKRVFILLMIILLGGCNPENTATKNINALQHRVTKLIEMDQLLEAKRSELYASIREFNSTLPDSEQYDITIFDTLMGAPEKDLLKAMFKNEQDVSYSGLLKTIVQKNEEIVDLKNQIDEIRVKLPEPYVVKPGDSHSGIVLNYLMQKHGLTKSEALKVAWRTSLVDEILPDYEVWLMYNNGIVGSFVTQGTAKLAPMTFHVLAKQKLVEKLQNATQNIQSDSTDMNKL